MSVRDFDMEKDYKMVSTWFLGYNWPVIPKELLAPTGFVSEVNGIPTCAAWLMRTDTSMAYIEPLIGNPLSDPHERDIGLDQLFEQVVKYSKEAGIKHLMAYCGNTKLMARGEKHGFTKGTVSRVSFLRSF